MTGEHAANMDDWATFVAKTLVPRRRPETLRRQRLIDRVADRAPGGIAVVRAPAGFGKTTLLVDVAHEIAGAVCWVSLDQWDSDVSTFLQYLRLAIRRSPAGTKVRNEADLAQQEPRAVLAGLLGALADFAGDAWIFLDDFHEVASSEDLSLLVDYVGRRLPPNCRLILGSRTPPNLPSLPKLQLEGRAVELGPTDLAFTPDEIRECYISLRGHDISDEEARAIFTATQGWPAGVALIYRHDQLAHLAEAPSNLSDYLAAEILARLPEQLRTFALATSIFDVLEAGACEAVTGERHAEELLQSLEKSGAPVMSVSGPAHEYRVHPLFRDFLRNRLREDPAEYQKLNWSAASWLAARGRMSEAIWHFVQSEDWGAACDLILEEAPGAYRLGRWHAITSWLERIPQSELHRRPRVRLWHARILARFGQSDDALRIVSETVDQLSGGEPALVAELETIRGTCLRLKGDIARARGACERAVHLAATGNTTVEVMAQARKQLGLVFFVTGSHEEAARELRAALDTYEQRGDLEEIAFVSGCLGSSLGSLGLFVESLSHLERARRAWHHLNNTKELSWVLNNLAVIYLWMGQADRAGELLLDSLGKARESGHRRAEAYSLVSLADLDLRTDDHTAALARYDESLTIATEMNDNTLLALALIGLAAAHQAAGDGGQAELLIHRVLADARERQSPYELGLGQLSLGKLRRWQGNLPDAIAAFEASATLLEAVNAKRELAESLFHLAGSRLAARHMRRYLKADLEKLAAVAGELTQDAFLLEACRKAPAVAEYAASRRIAGGFYRDLLRRGQTPAKDGTSTIARRHHGQLPLVEVTTLGDVEIRLDGRPVMELEWESEKSKEMFLLLLMTGQSMRRDQLIAALWPDTGGKKARSVFHSTLHRLRRALYSECAVESAGTYSLNTAGTFSCDALELQRVLRSLEDLAEDDPRFAELLHSACNIYNGPFAPALDAEWADSIRNGLEREFLEAASKLSEILLRRGNHSGAAEVCTKLLTHDPYNEAACFRLMTAEAASGSYDSAVYTYRQYAEMLARDIGDRPGRAITDLYTEIRDHLGHATSQPP